MNKSVKCPKCDSSEHVGQSRIDYCCHDCKFFWPMFKSDLRLIQHIMGEMRQAPGRFPDLENALHKMSLIECRDLHRLLRELNSNTNRERQRARRGF